MVGSALPASKASIGEMTPLQAWERLCADAGAVLVDVRTLPEWQFTGQPDVSTAKGRMLSIAWKIYPQMNVNAQFEAMLRAEGVDEDSVLLFLCRSGGRSHDAAVAMSEAGFRQCYNVLDGFEGKADASRHRGAFTGWKAGNLPWVQS